MNNIFKFLFDKDTWQELKESLTKNKLRTFITMIESWGYYFNWFIGIGKGN